MTIPDCCYELHFFYDENLTYIAGTSLRGRELKIPITSRCFGIRFQPMVAPMYFKHALHEIIDSNYEITHLHPFDTILRSLHAAATFEERIDRFNQSFFYNTSDYQMHPLINHMIQKIQKKNFDIKVIDMIKDSGYSQRQIRRIFKDNTGISIKFFLNSHTAGDLFAEIWQYSYHNRFSRCIGILRSGSFQPYLQRVHMP